MRLVAPVLCLLIAACSASGDIASAEGEIAKLHSQMNSGQIGEIYAGAGPEWKRASDMAMTQKIFDAFQKKLGRYRSGKQDGWRENYTTSGTFMVIQYKSQFEKGPAQETFTFRKKDARFELVGYNVNSPLLIIS